jgi:hypothetical protein
MTFFGILSAVAEKKRFIEMPNIGNAPVEHQLGTIFIPSLNLKK